MTGTWFGADDGENREATARCPGNTAKVNDFGVGPGLTNLGTLLVAFLLVGIGLSLAIAALLYGAFFPG